jgi:hypothetical protein
MASKSLSQRLWNAREVSDVTTINGNTKLKITVTLYLCVTNLITTKLHRQKPMRQNQLYRRLTMRGDNYNLHPANSPNAAVYHMDCKECCSYIVPFLDRTARLERNSCSGTLNAGSILLNIWGSNV